MAHMCISSSFDIGRWNHKEVKVITEKRVSIEKLFFREERMKSRNKKISNLKTQNLREDKE